MPCARIGWFHTAEMSIVPRLSCNTISIEIQAGLFFFLDIHKLIRKLNKKARMFKAILERKHKAEGIALPNFETYYTNSITLTSNSI